MRRIVGAVLVSAAAGCAGADPWGELSRVPPSFSSPYEPRVDAKPQEPAAPLQASSLTLAECIAAALNRNPATRSSWHQARAAAAYVGVQKSGLLPTLDAAAGATRSDTPELRDKGKGPENEFSAGFGLRYLLFEGGLTAARIRGAEADLMAANFRHNTLLQDVALNVELAYYERLATKAGVQVAEDGVRQSRYHVDLAQARLRSGTAAKFDVLKAETEKADSDLQLVRARSAERIAHGRLCQAMGVPVISKFEIETLADETRAELADVERLLDEASRKRPELQVARAAIESKRAGIAAAQSESWPTVSLGASTGWRDSDFPPVRNEWSFGGGIGVSLFSGFSTAYRTERARAEFAQAEADQDSLRRGVEFEVWLATSRLLEAKEAIDAAAKLVASADESARVAEGMYKAGAGSIIEMVDSLTARTSARIRAVQVGLDWRTALARVERAVGRTLARGVNR